MSRETSKALARRLRDPMFASTYFVGCALDIGAGNDSLGKQVAHWPKLTSVDDFDVGDGDAQELKSIKLESYDLVYSSHCLEHVRYPGLAVARWMEVLRPGGYLVVVVPDYDMYERGQWPSRFNADHKHAFTFQAVTALIADTWDAIKVERIIAGFDPSLPLDIDQTSDRDAECAIEFVVRKP